MSDCIFDLIESVAANASKNGKTTLLRQPLVESELARKIVEHALNPLKTFGIAEGTVPSPRFHGDGQFTDKTFDLLRLLGNRTLSGSAGQNALQIEMERLTEKSATLLRRIVLKDLRAGFGESTVNKIVPGLVPEFPYMRCSLTKHIKSIDEFIGDGAISQEKADGMFQNVELAANGRDVTMLSRQGTPTPLEKFAEIAEEVRKLNPGTMNHGELLVVEDGAVLPREVGNGILNSVIKGGEFAANQRPVLKLWDQIPLESFVPKGVCKTPYKQRLASLLTQLRAVNKDHITIIETRVVKSWAGALAHYREMLAAGKEGTVLKSSGAIWRDGTSKEQVKLKLEVTVTLEIEGIASGLVGTKLEGRPATFNCKSSDDLLRVDVTIKNEKLRAEVEADMAGCIGKLIDVTFNDLTEPGESNPLHSLYLGRMAEACFRADKTTADSLQRIKDEYASAIQG